MRRVSFRSILLALGLAVVPGVLAAPSDEAATEQPPWRSAMSDLERARDDTSAALTSARSTLLQRARDAGEKNLVAKLRDEPPEPLPRGYGILPEITDGPSTRPRDLTETRYSIEALLEPAKERAVTAEELASTRSSDRALGLESLVTEYEQLRDRLLTLDRQLAYHAYWQDAVVDYPAFFRERNRIVKQVQLLKQAPDRGDSRERIDVLEAEVQAKIAPFVPTTGLTIRTRRDGKRVLSVTVLTDITEKKFLKQFRTAVFETFSRSEAARALDFEVDLEIRRISPTELYPEGPPDKGEAIDLDEHVGRFPEGAMILTTGAESTHSWQGRSILFGPAPIRRNSLAHEFGHLLGFSDAYLRGFEGRPDDPYGVVLVEWSGLLDDLMGNSVAGAVSEKMILTLLEWYGPPGSLPAVRPVTTRPGLATDEVFATEVREAFLHAWNAYAKHAWGHDALLPLSRGHRDWYDVSLMMTPLDAFDTMLLMGLDDEAARAKKLILERLSFDHDMTVQVFEITIRLLGGLLSAYQMDGDSRFLELAVDLADRMLPAFESPTGMPYVRVNLRTGVTEWAGNNPAEIGTLMLEFGLLSRITGDPRYYDAAKRGVVELHGRRSTLGLVGTVIDVETGVWKNTESHVGGMIDSYYEYLLKSWLLLDDYDFLRMWEQGRDAINRRLATELDGSLWYGRVDMHTGRTTDTSFGALHAFLPAVLALGGDLDRAARLMESVYSMWTTFDVEPESFDFTSMEIRHAGYPLRPEAIESAYYLFVLTGDERYREMGRDIFRRIVRWTRVDDGFAHLADVRTKERADAMESFFLAETLKYAYLLATPGAIDFDAVVFNTEAHPLLRSLRE